MFVVVCLSAEKESKGQDQVFVIEKLHLRHDRKPFFMFVILVCCNLCRDQLQGSP